MSAIASITVSRLLADARIRLYGRTEYRDAEPPRQCVPRQSPGTMSEEVMRIDATRNEVRLSGN